MARKMDYHLHSTHSFDGKQTVLELLERARELGLEEICLTEHIEPGHPDPTVDHPPVYAEWNRDIEAAQEQYPDITVKWGIEIGDNPRCRESISSILKGLDLDFHLLSLHLVDNMDPYLPEFFKGWTQQEAYRRYAGQRLDSVLHWEDYDALAHLGYVGKFAPYPPDIRPFSYHHAPDELDVLLRHLAQYGKALEVNASGLIQTAWPIPGPDIIGRFVELGGEFFTFGSDAHMTQRVYSYVETAKEMARNAGARWQVGFTKRQMTVYPL